MSLFLQPWQLLLVILARWLSRQQAAANAYLRTENQVLREIVGTKRILLNDDQRRRLAVKGRVLGRRGLEELGSLFAPETILRWHRVLVARQRRASARKAGRPPLDAQVVALIVKWAQENPRWGYDRIQGALANLGYEISDQTVGNVLKEHGIEPVPQRQRQMTWGTFLRAHWEVLAAVDFKTVEVWTRGGLVTFYLLFVMELKTRRIQFVGCTPHPHAEWMSHAARGLTSVENGFLKGKRYLLMDRDATFTAEFRAILEQAGTTPVQLPPRSPNLNAHLERFMRSISEECLERMIFFGETSLRRAVSEFLAHFHQERNHQGLKNRIPLPGPEVGRTAGRLRCRPRLGGLLRYYYRAAA